MLFILFLYVFIFAIKRIKTKYTFEYIRDFRNMKQGETISKSIDSNIFTSIEEKTRKYKMYILVLALIYWLIIEIKPKKTFKDCCNLCSVHSK